MVEDYVVGTTDSVAAPDPAHMTRETVDLGRYYALDELVAMPSEVLEELWLACPERPFYEAALKRAVDDTYGPDAVVSDIDRLSVIDACILYYTGQHPDLPGSAPRIPTARRADGTVRWFKVSDRIRERLESGLPLEETQAEEKPGVNLRVVIPAAAVVLTVICVLAMLLRNTLGSDAVGEADMTATVEAEAAIAAVNHGTPTPTPLALDDIDRPIRAGEDLRDYYPVLLEIAPQDSAARVFPVQQREVEIAEWQFDPDPDVASAVLGLIVRPVLGIPYSAANASFLAGLVEGDAIQLRMSTGQTLLFSVSESERVSRQEVALFEQRQPGIAIVLLQEPVGDRLVVYGRYTTAQETLSSAAAAGSPYQPQGAPVEVMEGLSLTVLESATSGGLPGTPLPIELVYLLVDLEFSASSPVDTRSLAFEVVDGLGQRYVPIVVDAALITHSAYRPAVIETGETQYYSLAFIVPSELSSPVLQVTAGDYLMQHFILDAGASESPGIEELDVLVSRIEVEGTPDDPEEIRVSVRLYNPGASPVMLGLSDVTLVTSPVVLEDTFPTGPAVQEAGETLPLTVAAGEAVDTVFHFPWNGDPFAGIRVGDYQFIAALR